MKATEQYFPVVLLILQDDSFLCLEIKYKSLAALGSQVFYVPVYDPSV